MIFFSAETIWLTLYKLGDLAALVKFCKISNYFDFLERVWRLLLIESFLLWRGKALKLSGIVF
ncbi:hypothetical protein IPC1472_30005 [Pseudomonas aeruginosa]|nr:hypothetical protein AO947_15510 [Pseudomonas aeruginosa]KSJ79851.1 hypothetical protein APA06_06495 [Pseudomonas aeruginosa]KSN90235.1 hypothetical protein APA93_04655 [Pseudomonas aeruginosa]RMJ49177.1 hypothetical protein IPC1272_28705 [Pseudomonas aeruginosa]RPL40436.1 hypothetical protein IPC1472_30005 [Pseudomonas aeruginosa]